LPTSLPEGEFSHNSDKHLQDYFQGLTVLN